MARGNARGVFSSIALAFLEGYVSLWYKVSMKVEEKFSQYHRSKNQNLGCYSIQNYHHREACVYHATLAVYVVDSYAAGAVRGS
jgi:hypothetical protein